MESAANDTTRVPRRKDKTKKKAPKGDKEKQDRKRSRAKKPKLSTLAEGDSAATQGGPEADPSEIENDVERGLTQELILQLRALDIDDDDDDVMDGADGSGSRKMNSFYGHGLLKSNDSSAHTTVYVENEVSGEFFRVRHWHPSSGSALKRSKTSLRRLGRRRHHQGDSDSDDENRIPFQCGSLNWRSFRDFDTALGILGHGIVAGLSWMDAFNWGATRDRFLRDDDARVRFTCTYSSVADRTRQLFFLLFNLTLLGLMRKISRLRLQKRIPNEDERLEHFRVRSMRLLLGAFSFTAVALLVLLISSSSTLRLAMAFAQEPNWCQQISAHSASLAALARHQQYAVANAVFLSIGWFLVCIQCSMGMSSHLSLRRRLVETHIAMDQLELRADQLRGKAIDGLSIEALKDLIQQHHRAVEATEGVLVTKLQMQDPTAARGAPPSW